MRENCYGPVTQNAVEPRFLVGLFKCSVVILLVENHTNVRESYKIILQLRKQKIYVIDRNNRHDDLFFLEEITINSVNDPCTEAIFFI